MSLKPASDTRRICIQFVLSFRNFLPIPFMLAAKGLGLPEPDFRLIFAIFVLAALAYVTFLIPGKKVFILGSTIDKF